MCFLVSGDDDLTEAVEEAQSHGVQVIVLAVPNTAGKPHGVSRHLVRAADEVQLLEAVAIDAGVVKAEPSATVPTPPVPQPAEAAPVQPAKPSPLDLGQRRRVPPHVPQPTPQPPVAYSGSTGGESYVSHGYAESAEDYEEEIATVVGRVLTSLAQSSTERADLQRTRPSIPREIDRALLQDLSDALGVYDLNDAVRFALRDRFWEQLDARTP